MKTIEEIRAAFQRIHDRACGNTSIVYMSIPADPRRDADIIVADAIDELATARERIAALEAFKAYVHQRLDEAGIPTHPDGPHSKEGCRVGDRLDLLIQSEAQADKEADSIAEANSDLRERVAELEAQLEGALNKSDESRIHAFWDRKLVAAQFRAEAAEKRIAEYQSELQDMADEKERQFARAEAAEKAKNEWIDTLQRTRERASGEIQRLEGALKQRDELLDDAEKERDEWKKRAEGLGALPHIHAHCHEQRTAARVEGINAGCALGAERERVLREALETVRGRLSDVLGAQHVLKYALRFIRRWKADPNVNPDAEIEHAEKAIEEWHRKVVAVLDVARAALAASPDAAPAKPATVHISRPDGVELYVPAKPDAPEVKCDPESDSASCPACWERAAKKEGES